MRFLVALLIPLALLSLLVGSSPAQEDEEDREKRLAEIQKEIAELQARLAKLSAEAATLQWRLRGRLKRIKPADASAAKLHDVVRDLRFSPDDRTLLCSNWSPRMAGEFRQRRFSLWDVKTMKIVRPLMERPTTSLFEFAGRGERLVLAGLGEYDIQDTRTGKALYSLPPPKDWTTWNPDPEPLWTSPDGETMLRPFVERAKPDRKVTRLQTIRVRTGKVERELKLDGGFPVVAPDGRTVFTFPVEEFDSKATSKGRKDYRPVSSATAWNLADGKKRFTIEDRERKKFKAAQGYDVSNDTTPPRLLAFSPDGRRFLWFQDGPHFHVGDLATGVTLHTLPRGPFAGHESMAFSRDGRMVALDATGPTLWEVATGKQRHEFPSVAYCVRFSHDGGFLAAGGSGTVEFWDVWGRHTTPAKRPLSPAALEKAWKSLADEDAAKAFAAMRKLVQHASQSAPPLRQRVQAYMREMNSRRIAALIRDLDSDKFRVRQAAEQTLRQLGEAVRPALRRALASGPTLEGRRRVERILQSAGPPPGAWLQALRAIEVLEASPGDEAMAALKALVSQDAPHPLALEAKTSLERRKSPPP